MAVIAVYADEQRDVSVGSPIALFLTPSTWSGSDEFLDPRRAGQKAALAASSNDAGSNDAGSRDAGSNG